MNTQPLPKDRQPTDAEFYAALLNDHKQRTGRAATEDDIWEMARRLVSAQLNRM